MSIKDRVSRLRQKLAEKEIDGILVSQPENRRYLSGFSGSAGVLFITQDRLTLATDFRYTELSAIQAPDYVIYQTEGDIGTWLPKLMNGSKVKRLGYEADFVPVSIYRKFKEALAKVEGQPVPVPFEGLVETIRAGKEPGEIELISKAVDITDKAFEHVEKVARVGMTEAELSWEIEKFMRENGSGSVAFELMVGAGSNGALPHYIPGDRRLEANQPIVVDIGATYQGYAADMTRTIFLGEPDDLFKKVYDIVLGAQLTAIALMKDGMTGEQADALARTVIEEAGYGENFGHSLGHGVGLAVHEWPRLGKRSTDVLASGMAFTVEPGIYLSGKGGVRIEDTVVLENGKVRVLGKYQKVLDAKG